MPRPSLGRTILSVRITPECREALGDKPSEQASDVLERWAKTHRARAVKPEPEEVRPRKARPGRRAADEGR